MNKKLNIGRLLNLMLILVFAASFANAKIVDKEEATQVAAEFLSPALSKLNSKNIKMRDITQQLLSRHLTSTSEAPAFYVFTPEEGCGFAIVSADDAAKPVLGYSHTGTIDVDNIPPALVDMMKTWTKQINEARGRGIKSNITTRSTLTERGTFEPVVYLETAEWGQQGSYDSQCPIIDGFHCAAGCVPTAYSIIMRYYRYAKRVSVVTEEYTSENGVFVPSRTITGDYDWNKMPLVLSPIEDDDKECEEAVAHLLADIGAFCKVNYGYETPASLSQPKLLDLFGYTCDKYAARGLYNDSEWHTMLTQELDKRHPILYDGGPDAPDKEGHAFLLDGYTRDHYYHVNWGWGGSANGFFSLDALEPGWGDMSFNKYQSAILGIRPIEEQEYTYSYVAQVGDLCFEEMGTAMDYSSYTRESVVLLTDITPKSILCRNGFDVIDIDLNGHNITTSTICSSGTLSIRDSQGNGSIKFKLAFTNMNATLNIYGGRFLSEQGFTALQESHINIYGGIFNCFVASFVAEGYVEGKNKDPETCEQYPYTVYKIGELPEEDIVATVNGTQFVDFAHAIDYALSLSDEANIKLMSDRKIDNLDLDKANIILDVNGHTLTTDYITNYQGTLTLRDSKKSGKIIILSGDDYPLNNYGTLTIEDVCIDCSKKSYYCILFNKDTAILRGCKLSGVKCNTIICNYGSTDIYDSEIVNDYDIVYGYSGHVNIHSGRFFSNSSNPFYEFTNDITVIVEGGMFNFKPSNKNMTEDCFIDGNIDSETCGKYPYIVRKFGDVPEGFIAVSVNGQQFSSLAFALDYAESLSETSNIKMLNDLSIDNLYFRKDNIDFDLNGYTLSVRKIDNSAEMTIRDSSKSGKIEIIPSNEDYTLYNSGTFTIEDVTIVGGTEQNYCFFYNDGSAILRGCTLSGSARGMFISNLGNMDIYDCEINCYNSAEFIYCYFGKNLNIHSGRFYFEPSSWWDGGSTYIEGGMFGQKPYARIAEGYCIVDNTDPETCEKYPYKVVDISTSISPITSDSNKSCPIEHFTLDGKRVTNPQQKTFVISRNPDGSIIKRITK